MRVVLTRALPGDSWTQLDAHFEKVTVLEKNRPLTREELIAAFENSDVAICSLTDKIDVSMLGRVKCLVTFSVGMDHLDLRGILNAGIRIAHTPDVLTEATANLTWALLLAAGRKVVSAHKAVKEFNGFDPCGYLGKELHGASLGILGMGRIGRAVARRAPAFGLKLIYHNRNRLSADLEQSFQTTWVSLETLLKTSDILSLHCPLNEDSHHRIDAKALGMMKADAILINTARGAVIDEAALVGHLKSHPSFTAALDVYEKEPKLAEGLLGLPNALCLPHIGSAQIATREKMAQICVEEAIAFAKGEPLRYEHR